MKQKKRTKAGTSKAAAAQRRRDFVRAYIENGRNQMQAAIAAGYSPNGANVTANRLLQDPTVRALIERELVAAERITGLSLERTLLECARIAYADKRKFWREDGTMVPVAEWTDDMAAQVASLEVEERYEENAEGEKSVRVVGRKLKLWDKNSAIDKAMRHLGAFEKDNRQRSSNLALQINVVGSDGSVTTLERRPVDED